MNILKDFKKTSQKVKKAVPKIKRLVVLGGPSTGEYWPPEDMSAEEFYDRGWNDFIRGK